VRVFFFCVNCSKKQLLMDIHKYSSFDDVVSKGKEWTLVTYLFYNIRVFQFIGSKYHQIGKLQLRKYRKFYYGIVYLYWRTYIIIDFHRNVEECANTCIWISLKTCLPIKVYYRICTLRHIRIEINYGSQNVFWVLTWVWRILVFFSPRLWLGIKY
jgi:hypothetical protein